jgi:O-6-methylguanine DNA methyltransferase
MTIFQSQVWGKLKQIPKGRVTTYAELAKALGSPRASRAVGNALNKNPDAPQVPCHRVVCSDGRLGGYAGGSVQKIALLQREGLIIKNNRIVDFQKILYKF